MKKLAFIIGFLLVLSIFLFALYRFKLHPPYLKIAAKAESQGRYEAALEKYSLAALKKTSSLTHPFNSNKVALTGEDWIKKIESYISWICYSLSQTDTEYRQALEGIARCTTQVSEQNFITGKNPQNLIESMIRNEWLFSFDRKISNTPGQQKLIKRVISDSISILRLRTMSGYTYDLHLLDLRTGKRTSCLVYPNEKVTFLLKPRQYLLFCTSKVQFTQGLGKSSWESALNVIPIPDMEPLSIREVTLKTKVKRNE